MENNEIAKVGLRFKKLAILLADLAAHPDCVAAIESTIDLNKDRFPFRTKDVPLDVIILYIIQLYGDMYVNENNEIEAEDEYGIVYIFRDGKWVDENS